MDGLDWGIVALFLLGMIGIGIFTSRRSTDSSDFYVGGGKVPWWLSGVSHHVSGHSGVVFVAYAAIAYKLGFVMYIWWAVPIGIATILGAFITAPRWPRLRKYLGIQSPTEYMKVRYGLPSQQLIVWLGVLFKLLDIGAKWASMGILLNGFTGLPIWAGIIISGLVSTIYITIGGMWADMITDFVQFVVQLVAGIVMLIGVGQVLGHMGLNYFSMWHRLNELTPGFSAPFRPLGNQYSGLWVALYGLNTFLNYNGGNWNLAARFISTENGKEARKASILSGLLYFIWPLLIFAPMWAAPLLPATAHLAKPAAQLYPLLTSEFLPHGLIGLVMAALFASTMGMTVSDINTLSAVVQRDIVAVIRPSTLNISGRKTLLIARVSTVVLMVLTIVVGFNQNAFGGVIGLVLDWWGAMVGVLGIPLLLGLFKPFRHSNGGVTFASVLVGAIVFGLQKADPHLVSVDWGTTLPLLVTAAIYIVGGLVVRAMHRELNPAAQEMLDYISDPTSVPAAIMADGSANDAVDHTQDEDVPVRVQP